MIIVILQILVSLILLNSILINCKRLKIDINIHNMSMGLFFTMMILVSMVVSYKQLYVQLIIGSILFVISMILAYVARKELEKQNVKVNNGLGFFTTLFLHLLFWSQLIAFNFFIKSNYEKLLKGANEDI